MDSSTVWFCVYRLAAVQKEVVRKDKAAGVGNHPYTKSGH